MLTLPVSVDHGRSPFGAIGRGALGRCSHHSPPRDRILRPRTYSHLVTSPEETDQRIRKAFQHLGFNPEGPPGQITGRSKMSFRKNRWAAEISATVSPFASGSMVLCRVEMAGHKHYALLSEVADAVGDDAFDDQGVAGAVERLGKWSRLFGRTEVRHMHNVLRVSETVLTHRAFQDRSACLP